MRIENKTVRINYGMKHIDSLRRYAARNKDKRIEIDSEKLAEAQRNIREALKNSKKERAAAKESASKIRLTI